VLIQIESASIGPLCFIKMWLSRPSIWINFYFFAFLKWMLSFKILCRVDSGWNESIAHLCITRMWLSHPSVSISLCYLVLLKLMSSLIMLNFVTCKVTRANFRPRCSWGESIVKRINLPWIGGGCVHHPTNEPNRPMLNVQAKENLIPIVFKLAQRSGAIFLPSRMPHRMTTIWAQP
jgi:hypothetical protein